MKLNNKGMTIIEVLVCFVLVSTIMMSLFSTVSSFNDKRFEEKYRSSVLTYKNVLTKVIQDDFVKIGLADVRIRESKEGESGDTYKTRIYTVECTLKDSTKRTLKISQKYTKTPGHLDGIVGEDDEFKIQYGKPNELEDYPLPELGETYGKYDNSLHVFNPCETASSDCSYSKDLQINNVLITINNEELDGSAESHILVVYIELYHPDLGNRYAINIVSPINFVTSVAGTANRFNFPVTQS